jgi:hypothetical protein
MWVDFLPHAISMYDGDILELASQSGLFPEIPLDRLSHRKGFPGFLYFDPGYAWIDSSSLHPEDPRHIFLLLSRHQLVRGSLSLL